MANDPWEEMEALGRDNAKDFDELQQFLKSLSRQPAFDPDGIPVNQPAEMNAKSLRIIEETKPLDSETRKFINNPVLKIPESDPILCRPPPPLYILGSRAIRPVISEEPNESLATPWGPISLPKPNQTEKLNVAAKTQLMTSELPEKWFSKRRAGNYPKENAPRRKYKKKIYQKVEREQRKSKNMKRCSCCVQFKGKLSSRCSEGEVDSTKLNSVLAVAAAPTNLDNNLKERSLRLEFSETKKTRLSRVIKPKKCDCCNTNTLENNWSASDRHRRCQILIPVDCKVNDEKNEFVRSHQIDTLKSRGRVGRPRSARIEGTADAIATSRNETKQKSSDIYDPSSSRIQSNVCHKKTVEVNGDYRVTKKPTQSNNVNTVQILRFRRLRKSRVNTGGGNGSTENEKAGTKIDTSFSKKLGPRRKLGAKDQRVPTKRNGSSEILNIGEAAVGYATRAKSNCHKPSLRKYDSRISTLTSIKKRNSENDRSQHLSQPVNVTSGEDIRAHKGPGRPRKVIDKVPSLDDEQQESLSKSLADNGPYKCFQCGLHLRSFRLLGLHMETHNMSETAKVEEPPLACGVCNMRFYSVLVLNHHLSNFHGKYKYRCDICFASFKISESLEQHIQTHNRVTDDEDIVQQIDNLRSTSPTTGEFSCSICKCNFENQCELSSHLSTNHVNILDHKCKVCQKRFHNRVALREHTLILHSGQFATGY